MDTRAASLIATLDLVSHPEGGHFQEVFRATSTVRPADGRPERPALTTIYFLLAAGEVSRWHRVTSDEAWHFYEGAPLELVVADAAFERITRHSLGPVSNEVAPVRVVPAGWWQAARSSGAYTLVGCTVGPGFEYADFELMDPHGSEATRARQRHPEAVPFL